MKVRDAKEDFGESVLCVAIGPPASSDYQSREDAVSEICQIANLPYGHIQLSTVARLREAGFTLELDTGEGQADNHHSVYFVEPVDVEQVERFIQCFDLPVPNPVRQRRRTQ